MKGLLYEVSLEKETKISSENYESNDGRGTRSVSTSVDYFYACVRELSPCPKWMENYKSHNDALQRAVWDLEKVYKGLQIQDPVEMPEIPNQVKPEWEKENMGRVTLTKEEYETLLGYSSEEERYTHNGGKKMVQVLYLNLHSGMKGQYLNHFSSPGVTRHKRFEKYGFEDFTDLGESQGLSENSLLVLMGVFSSVKTDPVKWDFRYMPEEVGEEEEKNTTLGDIFQGLGL